jgi:hypothetical protein
MRVNFFVQKELLDNIATDRDGLSLIDSLTRCFSYMSLLTNFEILQKSALLFTRTLKAFLENFDELLLDTLQYSVIWRF